jgi:hypothetical protein
VIPTSSWSHLSENQGDEMRLKLMFWNYNTSKGSLMKKERDDAAKAAVLARLARYHAVDVLVLCECSIASSVLLQALQNEDPAYEAPLERFSIE